MKGFIVYATYKLIHDTPYVFLYGRLENNQSFVTINKYQPYFFIKTEDLNEAEQVTEEPLKTESTDLTTIQKQPVTKIITKIPADVKKLRDNFEDHSILTYEADTRFEQRFLIDKKLQGSLNIEGDYESEEFIDRIYKEPELTPTNYEPTNLKVLSIDIETDPNAHQIYCISLYTDNYKKVLIATTNNKLKNAESYPSEEEMLDAFYEKVKELDPDIITGWNVIDFDLNIIFKKLKYHKLRLDLGRDNTKPRLRIESDFFRTSKADFPGRQILDGIALLKSAFIKLPNYKLNTAAQKYLKEEKLITTTKNKAQEITDLYHNNQQELVDYNLKDSELVYNILKESNTLNLAIKRSLITGMPLNKVSATIASLDSLYFKKARDRKLVLPSSRFSIKENPITGGYVRESEPGIYNYIITLDFKSLYPSVIRTFNIDPTTFSTTEPKEKHVKTPNNVYFTTEQEGILPELIKTIWAHRDEYRKQGDEIGRFALKILMNSFYGAMASPASRYFNMDLANAITHTCQFIIKNTAKVLEAKGYKVIYQDTDSCFIISDKTSLESANKLGKKLEQDINNYYNKFIKDTYDQHSYLQIEFEKTYIKFLMPKIRGKEKGAKKRYAGIIIKDGKEKLDIVGMETVRSDWTELAKIYQQEILNRIFHDKDIVNYTKNLIKDLKDGKHDKDIIYRKQLRKPVEEYTKITPQHVKAAKKLDEITSNIIEYVITIEGPEPIQNQKNPINYEHYINKQIKPLADSVLVFFDTTFDELIQTSKQKSIFDY